MRAVNAGEIAKSIIRKQPLFVLDVRNEEAYSDWKIEGEGVQSMNIPYFELLDGLEALDGKIPEQGEILVVCAKEGSSILVAEMLEQEGHKAAYLEGGMRAWSEHLEPIKVGELADGGELFQFVRIGKGCLSYMLISDGKAAVIDAVRMTDVFLRFAEEHHARITDVFDTHLHADHISGGRKLAEETGGTYWLPPKDAGEVVFPYEELLDGTAVQIGSSIIEALYSPGHTLGSTSLIADGQYLFTGDILFVDSIGRPDLAGQELDWADDLRDSLYVKYRELKRDLTVFPAHFMILEELNEDGSVSAKLASLFKENHGLNIGGPEEFRMLVTSNLPPQPNAHQQIRQTNMGKLTPDGEEQREMEIGPNRCAVR